MQYLDPYELLKMPDAAAQELDMALFRRARQRLLAEFELHEDGLLQIGPFSYDKKSILDLLESFEQSDTRIFFLWIRHNAPLKAFLTGHDPLLAHDIQMEELSQNAQFAAFCSPFLAAACLRLLPNILADRQWTELAALIRLEGCLSSADFEEGFKALHNLITGNILVLEEAKFDPKVQAKLQNQPEIYDPGLIRQLNRLGGRFQALINRYSQALRKAAVEIDKQHSNPPLAWQLISAACLLDAELSTQEDNRFYEKRIGIHYDAYLKTQQTESPNASKSANKQKQRDRKVGRWVMYGIFAFFALYFISLIFSFIQQARKPEEKKERKTAKSEAPVFLKRRELPNRTARQTFRLTHIGSRGLMEEIKFAYKDIRAGEVYAVRRPSTGWNPFPQFCKKKEGEAKHRYLFKNESDKDLVLLIDGGFGTSLVTAQYVRKQEQVSGKLPSSFYNASVMNGSQWTDSLGLHEEKTFGGFTQEMDWVGTLSMKEKDKGKRELYFSFFSLNASTITMSFDGKTMRKIGGN